MTLSEAIIESITNNEPRKLGCIVDLLRFKYGMNYQDILKYINKFRPISENEFESMMYEADTGGE